MTTRSQNPDTTPRLEPLPDDLDSSQAKLVYLSLEATGGATVDDLGELLEMKKLSILSILNTLSSAGLVDRRGEEYVVSH